MNSPDLAATRPALARLATRFFGYLSGDGVNYLLGFAVYAWLIRVLNNTQYGELSVATNIYQILVMFVALGMDLIGPRLVRDAGRNPFSVVNRIQKLRIAVGCIICAPLLAIISTAYLRRGDVAIAAVLAGSFLMVLARALDVNYLAVAFSEPGILVRSRALGIAIYLMTLVALRFAVARYLWVIPVLNAVGVTIGRLWLAKWMRAKHAKEEANLSASELQELGNLQILARGVKASLGQLLLLAVQTLDVVLLTHYVSTDIVGQYSIVSRLYLFGTAILTALLNTFIPEVVAAVDDRENLQKHFRAFFVASALLGILGSIAFVLFTPFVCQTVAHRHLPTVAVIAPVYALVFLCMAVANPFSSTLPSFQLEGKYLTCIVGAALVLVMGDLILIPRYGALGAAWGQAISTCFLAISSATQLLVFFRSVAPGTAAEALVG